MQDFYPLNFNSHFVIITRISKKVCKSVCKSQNVCPAAAWLRSEHGIQQKLQLSKNKYAKSEIAAQIYAFV